MRNKQIISIEEMMKLSGKEFDCQLRVVSLELMKRMRGDEYGCEG